MNIYNIINEISDNSPIFKIEKGFPFSIKMNSIQNKETKEHYIARKNSFDLLSQYISKNLNNIENENLNFNFSFLPTETNMFNRFLLYSTKPSLTNKNKCKTALNGVYINIHPFKFPDDIKQNIPLFLIESNLKNNYDSSSINKKLIEFQVLLLMINEFLKNGNDTDTLLNFYQKNSNIQKVKNDYKKGIIEYNEYTENLLDSMINEKEDRYSFFVSISETKKNIKDISLLSKRQIIFWIENRHLSPSINTKEFSLQKYLFSFNSWIKLIKKEDIRVINKMNNAIISINSVFDSFKERISPFYINSGFEKFEKSFFKMSRDNRFILENIIKEFIINNDNFSFEEVKLHHIYLLLLAEKKPGIFLKGTTSYQLLKIFHDTAYKLNYDFERFILVIEFISQNNSIPKFNRQQWLEFLSFIIEEKIDIDENLTLYVNAVIPGDNGSNFSNNYFIDKEGYNFTKKIKI